MAPRSPQSRGAGGDELHDRRRLPMVWLDLDVVKTVLPRISPYATATYVHLVCFARDGVAWPSQKKLAERVNCSERQVRRALVELEEIGLIRVEMQLSGDRGRSTNHYLIVDPAELADVGPEDVMVGLQVAATQSSTSEGVAATQSATVADSQADRTNTSRELTTNQTPTVAAAAAGSLRDRFETAYKAAETVQQRSSVLGRLFQDVTGRAPDYPRLGRLAKDLNSGYDLGLLILDMASADIGDDPHDYLQAMVQTRKAGRRDRRQPATDSAPEPFDPDRYRRGREQGGKR